MQPQVAVPVIADTAADEPAAEPLPTPEEQEGKSDDNRAEGEDGISDLPTGEESGSEDEYTYTYEYIEIPLHTDPLWIGLLVFFIVLVLAAIGGVIFFIVRKDETGAGEPAAAHAMTTAAPIVPVSEVNTDDPNATTGGIESSTNVSIIAPPGPTKPTSTGSSTPPSTPTPIPPTGPTKPTLPPTTMPPPPQPKVSLKDGDSVGVKVGETEHMGKVVSHVDKKD